MTEPLPNSDTSNADDTGGEPRLSTTLARAEAAVADLAKDYTAWALTDVKKARAALDAATGTAAGDQAQRGQHVEALFRVAHDLKGQGSSFGYPLITKIGHSLCVLTRDRTRTYEARHLELAKAHLDAIDLVLTKGIKGEGGQTGAALVAKLESRVKDVLA